MCKLEMNKYDNRYLLKIGQLLKKKPRTKEEAQQQVEIIFPDSELKIDWYRKEIGPFRWEGNIYNPILKKRISDCNCDGYDLGHGLLSRIFNRYHKGSGGIALNIYGCIAGKPISYRQELRLREMMSN